MKIAVDFDGTIVEEAYPYIGKPIPFAIDVLKRLIYEDQHQVILWTVREGKLLDEAVEYCRRQGVEFYAVNKLHPETKAPQNIGRCFYRRQKYWRITRLGIDLQNDI